MTSTALARAGVRHAGRAAGAWWRTVRAEAAVEGTILPPANIVYDDLSNLRIGRSSIVHPFSGIAIITQGGSDQRCGLYIGERTSIGTGANLRGSGGVITIGDDCLLGQQVSVIAANHTLARDRTIRSQRWSDHPVDVVIEDDVHIGASSLVLPGAVVGRGAVVAGGSVVRGNVEPYTIVAGVPARPVGVRQ